MRRSAHELLPKQRSTSIRAARKLARPMRRFPARSIIEGLVECSRFVSELGCLPATVATHDDSEVVVGVASNVMEFECARIVLAADAADGMTSAEPSEGALLLEFDFSRVRFSVVSHAALS